MIYHIIARKDWEKALSEGSYSPLSLKTEGFVHCSRSEQVTDTAGIFFKGQKDLALLCIDEQKLEAEYRYEDPSGGGNHDPSVGALFPHVYGSVNLSAVVKVVDFPCRADGSFALPQDLL